MLGFRKSNFFPAGFNCDIVRIFTKNIIIGCQTFLYLRQTFTFAPSDLK